MNLLRHLYGVMAVVFVLAATPCAWGASVVAEKIADLPETHANVEVRSMNFSPDGSRLAAESDGGKINIWDWKNRRVERTIEKPRGTDGLIPTNPLWYSPNGRLLASCHPAGVGGVVNRVWNTADWSIANDIIDARGGCDAAGFSSDGQLFLRFVNRYNDPTDNLIAYSVDGWLPAWSLRLEQTDPVSLAINPDGLRLALGGVHFQFPAGITNPVQRAQQITRIPTITIVDLATHKVTHQLTCDAMGPVAWSADGSRLEVVGRSYVEIFDVHSGERLVHERLEASAQMNVRYSPDGRYLIESDQNGRGIGLGVTIWNSERHKLLQSIPGNINSIDVSRDSKYLALGTKGRTTIWQLK